MGTLGHLPFFVISKVFGSPKGLPGPGPLPGHPRNIFVWLYGYIYVCIQKLVYVCKHMVVSSIFSYRIFLYIESGCVYLEVYRTVHEDGQPTDTAAAAYNVY